MTKFLEFKDAKIYFLLQQIFFNPTFVGIFCLSIGIYFLLRRDPRLKHHLKQLGGPPSHPLIGNALSFIRLHHEIVPMCGKWINKYGTIFGVWMGNFLPYVILAEPDAIEKVLSSTVHIEKGKLDYGLLYDWLGWGLLTAPKQKWIHTRKLLTPAFHFKTLANFLPIFNKQASILLKCVEIHSRDNGKSFDMFPYLTKLTTDIICETAMGKQLNAQTNSSNQKYCDAVENYAMLLFNKIVKPWFMVPFFYNLTSSYKIEKEYLKSLKELPAQILQSNKVERQNITSFHDNNNFNKEDGQAYKQSRTFLDILLDTSQNNLETFTEKNIQEEVATFMFAGHDTTAVFFMWAIHLLANHPECQQKLQDELDTIFSDDASRDVTVADISEMKYLECCVKETLRLCPSAPFITRQIESDIVLNTGKIIPKGVTVLISIYYTHRHADYYDDPNEFKPERFSSDNAVKRHPFSYIPFSGGSRNCIGQKYALMEAKVVLAKLLRTYWIEPVDKLETLRKLPYIVFRCSDGVRVKLHKRKSS